MRLFRRFSSRWELSTERHYGSQELYAVRGGSKVFLGELYTGPSLAHRNLGFIERAMTLLDILNTRAMAPDDVESALQKLYDTTRLRKDADDTPPAG